MIMAHSILAAEVESISVFTHFVVAGGWITWFILIPLSVISPLRRVSIAVGEKIQVPLDGA
mgnify:CR=1 FL=1